MSRGRHGKMRDGWVRQAAQIPKGLGARFRDLAAQQGSGGVKSLTTIGLALVTEMPPEYRAALVRYLAQKTVIDPDGVKPGELYTFLRQMILEDERTPDSGGARWYIDRILDPELTPPPGEKASDRKKANREKRA